MQAGVAFRGLDSWSSIGGVTQIGDLARNRGAAQIDIALPVFSRKPDSPSPLGTLSLNANVALERLSDVGTLRTFGYGLAWSPVPAAARVSM